MRVKIGFVFIAFAVAMVGILPGAAAQRGGNPDAQDPAKWRWVCHIRNNGSANLIIVGENAAWDHVTNHPGDWMEDYVPAVPPPGCE